MKSILLTRRLKLLISKSPKSDLFFTDVRCFINDCRSMLHELKIRGVDLLDGGSAGCKLMSHIIFSKLPPSVNPFASIGRTSTSNVFLLKSAGQRTGTSNEKSMSKVSLYISCDTISFFLSFMVLGKHSNL